MKAKYPNEIITWEDKENNIDIIEADHINQAYAEIIAIEKELDQTKIKLVKTEKELNDYKKTIQQVNINQEPKQTASGYGIVSLPPNAANGQVSGRLGGLTSTNLVKNGDFKDGVNNWSKNNRVAHTRIENGQCIFLANGQWGRIINHGNYKKDHIYYICGMVKADSDLVEMNIMSSAGYITKIRSKHSGSGEYERLSAYGRITTDVNNPKLTVEDFRQDNFTEIYVKDVYAIDLTDTFGAGNEPTKEECDLIFANYFDGTKSTISAMRFTSENEDKTEKSQAYVVAKDKDGKIVNLMSHEGIHDEIDLDKGVLIKRVGVGEAGLTYQLAEPEVIPVQVSGSVVSHPSGTVYIDPATTVAGVYMSGITVTHTDLPIGNLERITVIDYATGLETELDVSQAVISEDMLLFTHPDITDGDIVFFEYEYGVETTQGETTIQYYDSRYTIKDSVTGAFYKWNVKVADGVPSIELVEV